MEICVCIQESVGVNIWVPVFDVFISVCIFLLKYVRMYVRVCVIG